MSFKWDAKKVMLAQCLLLDTNILIFDEPTDNLDPTARNKLLQLLLSLKQQGKTIIVATHILKELEPYLDAFLILNNGKINLIQERKVNEIWDLQEIYDQVC